MQSASFALALTFTLPPKLTSDSTSYLAYRFLHKSSPTTFVVAVPEKHPHSLLGFSEVYGNI